MWFPNAITTPTLQHGGGNHLTHEDRQRIIRAPLMRGILASCQYPSKLGAGGFACHTPSDVMPGTRSDGRARRFRKLPTGSGWGG